MPVIGSTQCGVGVVIVMQLVVYYYQTEICCQVGIHV